MRRFIAAANCPSCGNTDTLFVEPEKDASLIQCSRCDFVGNKEEQPSNSEEESTANPDDKDNVVKWH